MTKKSSLRFNSKIISRNKKKKIEEKTQGIEDMGVESLDNKGVTKERFDYKDVISAILLSVLVMLVSIKTVSVDKGFMFSELKKNDVYTEFDSHNISYSSLNANATKIMDYIALKNDVKDLNGTFLNEKEKLHMIDVRGIFEKINMLMWIFFPLTLVMFFLIYMKKIAQIYKAYILSFIFVLLYVAVLVVLALNFNSFFYNFHKIFFTNNLWLLNPKTDLLILMFPENYFRDSFVRILVYPVVISFFFFFSGLMLRKQEKNEKKRSIGKLKTEKSKV